MIRTCRECGKQFETKSSRRLYCYDQHYRVCSVCGRSFAISPMQMATGVHTCSEECRRRSIGKTCAEREPMFDCVCDICGKHFKSAAKNARICNDAHTMTCPVCGKVYQPTHQQLVSGTATCSDECRYKLAKQTNLERYGVENPGQVAEFQEKQKATMRARYGEDNARKIPEFVEKSKATSLEKYGVESFTQTEEFIKKTTATNRRKFGADWKNQTPEGRLAVQKTCMDRYGVDNFGKSASHISTKMTDPSKLAAWMEFREDPGEFIKSRFDYKPTLSELSEVCGVRDSSIGWFLEQQGKQDIVGFTYSSMEDQVYRFLLSIGIDDSEIIRNTHRVITPYELDVYLPKYKLAIECNPTYTHNSTIGTFGPADKPKARGYHKMKSDRCEDKGIFLFHIFGYEWVHRNDVIKSMLRNLLQKNDEVVYARTTQVQEVDSLTASKFLDANHRQGAAVSSIRLGLYCRDKLVSLMTFSKMRNTLGTGSEDLSDCYELVRFCSKLNTSVVGGASKLFQYFVKTYSPTRVRSFSDRAHTRGGLYEKLGFIKIHETEPSYVWVNLKNDKSYSRVNAQKRNIIQFLGDPDIDLDKSEKQIMEEHGFVQVFDSGVILWEYNR